MLNKTRGLKVDPKNRRNSKNIQIQPKWLKIKQTDRQTVVKKSVMITANRLTYKQKKSELFGESVPTTHECLLKIRKISHQELGISLNLSNISNEVSQLAN